MDRRKYVCVVGTSAVSILAGCSSRGNANKSNMTEPEDVAAESNFTLTSTEDMRIVRNDEEFADSYPDEKPFTEIVVGEKSDNRDNPHGVRVFLKRDASVDLNVSLTTKSGPVFEGEGTVKPNTYLAIAIWSKRDYSMRIETDNLHKEFSITRDLWDARNTQHNVVINDSGINVELGGAG